MANFISCIVVDDDEVDSLILKAYLETHPGIQLHGIFHSPALALEKAKKEPPDCIFLDIDMAEMSGIELRKNLMHIPACIFITSYPDYALESYEVAALDFLVKPFSAERLSKTISRLESFITLHRRSELLNHSLGADTIFIKEGHQQIKLQLHEIIYLEALNNYTSIVTRQRKYTVLSPLSALLKEPSFNAFIRIHRSYAVQKNFISRVSADEVIVSNHSLPVGRTFKETLNRFRNK